MYFSNWVIGQRDYRQAVAAGVSAVLAQIEVPVGKANFPAFRRQGIGVHRVKRLMQPGGCMLQWGKLAEGVRVMVDYGNGNAPGVIHHSRPCRRLIGQANYEMGQRGDRVAAAED